MHKIAALEVKTVEKSVKLKIKRHRKPAMR